MERKIARIVSTMLGFERGIFTATLRLNYGEGLTQGTPGYRLDGPIAGRFIPAVLRACGAEQWELLPGRTVYALIRDGLVVGLEPLPTERGQPFMFEETRRADVADR